MLWDLGNGTCTAQNFESRIHIVTAKIFPLCFLLLFFSHCHTRNRAQRLYDLGACGGMGPKSSELPSVVTDYYYYIDIDIVDAI